MTITISLKLFATLGKYKPSDTSGSSFDIELNQDMTIEQLVLQLGVRKKKVRTISLNEKIVKIDTVLADGDVLILFPTIAGG